MLLHCFRRKESFASKEIVWKMGVNMTKKWPQYTGKETLAILRNHHLEGVPVSDICDERDLQPAVFYPQSNGNIESSHKSVKTECIRPATSLSLENAQAVVRKPVAVYNTEWLYSAIGYTSSQDKLEGREAVVLAERKRKLAEAREARGCLRQSAHSEGLPGPLLDGPETGAACAAGCLVHPRRNSSSR